jgi:hypothetical protein
LLLSGALWCCAWRAATLWLCLAAPANDQFANRAALVGTSGTSPLDFTFATVEPGEDARNRSASVWFKITPSTSVTLQLSVVGSTDATVAVFADAATLAGLVLVGVNASPQNSAGLLSLLGRRTYAIQVAASRFAGGISLQWALSSER